MDREMGFIMSVLALALVATLECSEVDGWLVRAHLTYRDKGMAT